MPFGRWMRLVGWRHVVAVVVVWALFPMFYVISLSLSGGNTLTSACSLNLKRRPGAQTLVPHTLGFSNYQTILTSDQYPFVVWITTQLHPRHRDSVAALLMGACAAYAFSRMRFSGRRLGLLGLMLVQMFPAVLAITAVYFLLDRILDVFPTFGLGSIWGTLLIYLGGALGVNTFLMKGYFDTIPIDLDEVGPHRRGRPLPCSSTSS